MKLSQHAMHQLIIDLGDDIIQQAFAVKIPPIKEPVEAQMGRRERVETFGSFA